MANPLQNEKELYEQLSKEKVTIHPILWELLKHHIGNDIYMIQLIAGSYVENDMPEAIPVEDGKKIMNYSKSISKLMDKIKKTSDQNKG